MNKKMLLVVLLPVVMNAHVAELLSDIKGQASGFINLANAPFGQGQPTLNEVAAAVSHDLAQRHVKNVVSAIDAKFLGKTLVDAKGVTLTTGDILCFASAVAVSCAADKVNDNEKSHAQNAVSHATTRLTVAGLEKAYDKVASKAASFLGVDVLDFEATINDVLPEDVAAVANYARNVLVHAAVYGVVRNVVGRTTEGFFAKP